MSQPSTSSGPAVPTIPENHAISIPPPANLPAAQPDPKHPRLDLLLKGSSREKYISDGIPLYEAALKGDWKAAKAKLDIQNDLVRFAITENHETLLHIAASAVSTKAVKEFVKNLVDFMGKDDLELQNKTGDTALNSAAQAGNIEIAKIMLEKNPGLIDIPNKKTLMPLYIAALFAHPEMVRHLYSLSNKMASDFWNDNNRCWVLQKCVESEIFDVAIKIVNDIPKLLDKRGLVRDILFALAGKTKAFEGEKPNFIVRVVKYLFRLKENKVKETEALQLLKIIWRKIAKLPKDDVDDILRGKLVRINKENKEKECEALPYLKKIWEKMDSTGAKSEIEKENQVQARINTIDTYPSRVLFVAAKMGNTLFITEIIRLYPDTIWKIDDKGKTIFHLAIKRRHAKIYNLLYEIGAMKDLINPISDKSGNNMLHMVSKSGKQTRFKEVSGVVLQMQRELLWYKEVEKMIPPQYRERKNKAGETPKELFTKKHADLVTKGEQWMKDTSSQCMVAATLIATIVFAAAFTLPGGYDQDTGIPFFRKEPSLIIFVIADALSLISSSTSVLIFLSILTSRYAEHDFLTSLPYKLMFGILTLFLSIVAMMVAFSASFFVLYNKKVEWVPITITGLAVLPVIVFLRLQFRLVKDVYFSTIGSRYLFKPKHILYC